MGRWARGPIESFYDFVESMRQCSDGACEQPLPSHIPRMLRRPDKRAPHSREESRDSDTWTISLSELFEPNKFERFG